MQIANYRHTSSEETKGTRPVSILVECGEFFEDPPITAFEATPWGQMMIAAHDGDTVLLRVVHDRHFTGQCALPLINVSQCQGLRGALVIDYWNCGLGEFMVLNGATYLRTLNIEHAWT